MIDWLLRIDFWLTMAALAGFVGSFLIVVVQQESTTRMDKFFCVCMAWLAIHIFGAVIAVVYLAAKGAGVL